MDVPIVILIVGGIILIIGLIIYFVYCYYKKVGFYSEYKQTLPDGMYFLNDLNDAKTYVKPTATQLAAVKAIADAEKAQIVADPQGWYNTIYAPDTDVNGYGEGQTPTQGGDISAYVDSPTTTI